LRESVSDQEVLNNAIAYYLKKYETPETGLEDLIAMRGPDGQKPEPDPPAFVAEEVHDAP